MTAPVGEVWEYGGRFDDLNFGSHGVCFGGNSLVWSVPIGGSTILMYLLVDCFVLKSVIASVAVLVWVTSGANYTCEC